MKRSFFVSSSLLLIVFGQMLFEVNADCPFTFNPDPLIINEEGAPVNLNIVNTASPTQCSIVGDTSKFDIQELNEGIPQPIEGHFNVVFGAVLQFTALDDGDCHDNTYTFGLNCNPDQGINSQCTINVIVIDDDAGACEDPHLRQKVRGIDEDGNTVIKNICFDLYGKAGDQFELISDKILKTSLVFELRDDYYIGKTFYQTNLGFFNVTTTSSRSDKMLRMTTENNYVIGNENEYPYAFVEKSLTSTKIGFVENERAQIVKINKIDQNIGKKYLNALIEHSESIDGVFDEHHGGIFGYVANQEYVFYEPIQDFDITVVKINGRFVKAYLKNSLGQNENCYSMSLEDIIYPKTVYSFQKSL